MSAAAIEKGIAAHLSPKAHLMACAGDNFGSDSIERNDERNHQAHRPRGSVLEINNRRAC